jgi:hypothetical protein
MSDGAVQAGKGQGRMVIAVSREPLPHVGRVRPGTQLAYAVGTLKISKPQLRLPADSGTD